MGGYNGHEVLIYEELERYAIDCWTIIALFEGSSTLLTIIYLFANSIEQEVSKPVEQDAGEGSTEKKEAAPST